MNDARSVRGARQDRDRSAALDAVSEAVKGLPDGFRRGSTFDGWIDHRDAVLALIEDLRKAQPDDH